MLLDDRNSDQVYKEGAKVMQKSNFREWSRENLDDVFGLNQTLMLEPLTDWLTESEPMAVSSVERDLLVKFRKNLIYRGDDWNEIELIEHFIAPVLALIDFDTEEFALFAGRMISAIIEDYELSGEPDAIIATGRRAPKIPYFCFHEYKSENEPKGDPAGQALVAMLVSQELNQHQVPIYGLYIVGERWRFMVLKEKEYCISLPYSAVKDEIFDIFKVLKALKEIIIEIVKREKSNAVG